MIDIKIQEQDYMTLMELLIEQKTIMAAKEDTLYIKGLHDGLELWASVIHSIKPKLSKINDERRMM